MRQAATETMRQHDNCTARFLLDWYENEVRKPDAEKGREEEIEIVEEAVGE